MTGRVGAAAARLVAALAVLALLVGAWWVTTRTPTGGPGPGVAASSSPTRAESADPASGLSWVSLAELPPEASATLAEIKAGPPFPTRKDGSVFGNFEGLLPKRASGYYREFTVPTPGEDDRGARRIVTGGPDYGAANEEYYYTGDHYASFERIRP
nr:ribonuclease N1 [Propionibacterium sp.]